MSQSLPHLISIRAIEDIIQVQKNNEKLPKVTESEVLKEKLEDFDHSPEKYNPGCTFAENLICLPRVIEGHIIKRRDVQQRKWLETNGSEGDHQNPQMVRVENCLEKEDSEFELKSWPSDSDVTVIRVKREFRNELSTRVSWEEERNLTEKSSSMNFDWESHSLINLADITIREKDIAERLTPFTIWSKDNCKNEVKVSNPNSDLVENEPPISSKNILRKPNSLLFCPQNEKIIYNLPNLKENKTGSLTFCNPKNDILPVLEQKIYTLYEAEPIQSVNSKSQRGKIETIPDLSASGNKVSQRRKLKLLRGFFSFIAKCGYKKTKFDNYD